jgi:hypothetical protein
MRCILVNNASLKADSCCTYCRAKIGDNYLREIGSNFLYCNYACYQSGASRASEPFAYTVPALSAWTLRCDHCRGSLGPRIQPYWQMRFCSPGCVAAYQERLADGTRTKIRSLEARGGPQRPNRAPSWAGSAGVA